MIESNEKILISGQKILKVLAEVEFILISLHNMGSYYIDKPIEEYQRATTDFIDEHGVTHRLAKIRKTLKSTFNNTRGSDDMTDIERHLQGMKFWTPEKPALTATPSASKKFIITGRKPSR